MLTATIVTTVTASFADLVRRYGDDWCERRSESA